MAQIQGPHPVARWVDELSNLGRRALQLIHPLLCSAMASFGVASVAISPTFRTLKTKVQLALLSCLCLYAVFSGCIAFGKWSTNRAMNTGARLNGLVAATLKLFTLVLVVWIASLTFFERDYPLALGAGTLAIQSLYVSYHQSYNVPSRNIVVGLLSIGAMVIVREFDRLVLGLVMVFVAALLYSCN